MKCYFPRNFMYLFKLPRQDYLCILIAAASRYVSRPGLATADSELATVAGFTATV